MERNEMKKTAERKKMKKHWMKEWKKIQEQCKREERKQIYRKNNLEAIRAGKKNAD